MVVLDSIGSLEQRLQVVEFIFSSFNPIYPQKYAYTREIMNKIGCTLLPELINSSEVRSKFDQLLGKNYNHFKETVSEN